MSAPDAHRKFADAVQTLDPTQLEAYNTIADGAQQRYDWELAPVSDSACALALEFLLLGTAGIGKTHTAKTAITKVQQRFQFFDAVLTLAFSGVAAANLGSGSRTIDSVFHRNTDDAAKDLTGDNLDRLVTALRDVRLLVFDETSNVGAAQFGIVGKRLQQVGRVLWRERFRREQPDDLGAFGGVGVVLMGDFAQLPPVLSSTLLGGAPLQEGMKPNLRFLALSGRRTFSQFENALRLRHIHRQKGADPYKESRMRLRDAKQQPTMTSGRRTLSTASTLPGGENTLKEAL